MRIELTASAANFMSFDVGDLNQSAVFLAEFRDSAGNLVYSTTLTASNGVSGTVVVEIPYGIDFSSVTLSLTGDTYAWVDNLSFQRNEYVESADTIPTDINQTIIEKTEYFGGNEDNIFSIADVSLLNDAHSAINGNDGLDTLKLTGANQVLDLSVFTGKISSIEVIDLKGTGNNTLKLSLEDVLSNGETDLFHVSGKTQMMVTGDAGDTVDLKGLVGADDPGAWSDLGQVTVGGVAYEVYSHSSLDAELLVQQGVNTNLV